jgi:hypothetical protein
MRKSVKRAAIVGAAVIVMTGTGIAYAAWTASGSGSGYAKATTAQALTTVDATADTVAQLYPGASGDVHVTIHNPNPYPVTVTSIGKVSNGTITASGGTGTCTTTGVSFDGATGLSILVPAKSNGVDGSASYTLVGKAHMDNSSDDGCQGAVFTIPVSLSGASSAS